MLIDQLNLNQLRVFSWVYRTRSMTQAASELHLTQSGVSQHIKSLEEALRVKLFDRVNHRLLPTEKGKVLFDFCEKGLEDLEAVLSTVTSGKKQISGKVSIGMPIEFGTTILMPILAKYSQKHRKLNLKIVLDFASVLDKMIVDGDLDFGVVDEYRMDKRIRTEPIFHETINLCMHKALVEKFGPVKHLKKYYDQLDYVGYQEGSPILRMWFKHHLKGKPPILNVRATVMDVQGVARLVTSGLGAGVLPAHLTDRLKREGQDLYVFKGCGKPLKNQISLAYLEERTHSVATLAVLEEVRASLSQRK